MPIPPDIDAPIFDAHATAIADWLLLNPDSTAKQIATMLEIPSGSVYQVLTSQDRYPYFQRSKNRTHTKGGGRRSYKFRIDPLSSVLQ